MAEDKPSIAQWFKQEDAKRREILQRARLCAALSKPYLLKPENHSPNDKLPETYQSDGARGLTNITGRILMAAFPPDTPWFTLEPSPEVKYSPDTDPVILRDIEQQLLLRELMAQATLEGSELSADNGRFWPGFRSQKRTALDQVLATGDTLECLTDQYRLKVFGREQYVTHRDGDGAVMYHIICEEIDILTLTSDEIDKAKLRDKVDKAKRPCDRIEKVYTLVEWNPTTKMWVITQEANEIDIRTSEEPISPFFCTSFDLAPGEHYGRGFIEMNLGDLRSFNELEEKILDFAALHSKQLIAKDYASLVRDQDLAKESGEIIQAKVTGGKVDDVGILSPSNAANFNVVFSTSQAKKKSLAAAMLMESAMQPQKERVTAAQVQRIAAELEGALGGFYTPIADQQQGPLVRRVLWQMSRDKYFMPLPDKTVNIKVLTGINAISREVAAGKLLEVVSLIAQLGPEGMQRVNVDTLIQVLMRYRGIYEPGVVKSKDEFEQEARQKLMMAMQQAAGEQAAKTAGNVIENQLTQQTAA